MKPVSLTELRKKIDRVDIRIVRLIQKRMILAIAIGQLKKSNRQPVEIKQREKKVLANWEIRKARGEISIPALHEAMDEVLDIQAEKLAITRRIAGDIKDIWILQPRFEKRTGKNAVRAILEYLKQNKVLNENQIYQAIADKHSIPFTDLKDKKIRKDILMLIPEAIAQAHKIIAFDKDEKDLHIATLNPKDIELFDFLKKSADFFNPLTLL